jgi:hypothetical protein
MVSLADEAWDIPGRTPCKSTSTHMVRAKLAARREEQYRPKPNHREGLIHLGYRLYRYRIGSPTESETVSTSPLSPPNQRNQRNLHPKKRDKVPINEIVVSEEEENG